MNKIIKILILPLMSLTAYAQESTTIFNFLKLPTSSHVGALGGSNISLIEDDASLIFYNPALLSSVSDKTINLNFMTYMQGSKVASAAFSKIIGERSTLGFTAQYAHYGTITETTPDNIVTGNFSAMDMAVGGMYSYYFNDYWTGGATGKMIYSTYADYSSVALAVDLGLNYFNENNDFSVSAVARNLGGQVKAFGSTHEKLPFDLQLGFTKGIAHAPIRVSVTMTDLTRWSSDYYYNPEKKESFSKILLNHFVLGVDVLPTDYLYLSAGYNIRRANEMKAAGSSHGAGWTFGAGLQLSRYQFGFAYAKYHVSTPSFIFTASFIL